MSKAEQTKNKHLVILLYIVFKIKLMNCILFFVFAKKKVSHPYHTCQLLLGTVLEKWRLHENALKRIKHMERYGKCVKQLEIQFLSFEYVDYLLARVDSFDQFGIETFFMCIVPWSTLGQIRVYQKLNHLNSESSIFVKQ